MANITYRKLNDRKFTSALIEYSYFSDIGRFFGLSREFLQKMFSEIGNSKFEKKRLKQCANSITKNSYYEHFNKTEYDVNLIHSTPLYKRLTKETFWSDSTITEAINAISFGSKVDYFSKREFCCEVLTMLLYAYSSMAVLFYDNRLVDIFSIFPHWMGDIFDKVNQTQDIINKTNEDDIHIDYESAATFAGILMTFIRDTWVYDYISAVAARSIIHANNFPTSDDNPEEKVMSNFSSSESNLNIIFSGLTQMLALMLHDRKSMIYLGNLPVYMIEQPQILPCISVTPILLENLGKMFWCSETPLKDTKSFLETFSEEFTLTKDGYINYIYQDLYDDSRMIYIPIEKWIYATGTISTYEDVYNVDYLMDILNTNDMSKYIRYVATELNEGIIVKNNLKIFTIGKILDNYKDQGYVFDKPLEISIAPNQYTYAKTLSDLADSKQFEAFDDIISYKRKTEIGPNLLIRTISSYDTLSKGVIMSQMTDIAYARYYRAFADNPNISSIYDTEEYSKLSKIEELEILKDQIDDLCKELIISYFVLYYNIFRIVCDEDYRNLSDMIFIHSICANSYRMLSNGFSSLQKCNSKIIKNMEQILNETNKKLTMYVDKYKQCKSDNSKLEGKLRERTRECSTFKSELSKLTASDEHIKKLEEENEMLRKEPAKLNQTIAKQAAHIKSIENKQSFNEQYERRIQQLEEELARKDKLLKSIEEDSMEDNSIDNLTDEEKCILSKLKVDFTVWECESTKRLQSTIMVNSNFNFIRKSKTETTQFNVSKNADIYVLATNVISHSDARKWQQLISNRTDRSVYSPTNGYNSLCQIVLNKYYSMVEKGLIEPILSTI